MMLRAIFLSLTLTSVAFAAPTPRAKASFDRGEKALASDKLTEAEAAYREAVEASPDYAAAINGLGSVYFKQGKRSEAIQQFRGAIQADPKFALAYFNLGYAARKIGDFSTAAQAYETYTKLKPEDADGFYGLGESHRQLSEFSRAIAAYEQYVQREQRPSEQTWVERAKQTISELKAQLEAARAQPAPAPAPEPVVAQPAPSSAQVAPAPDPVAATEPAPFPAQPADFVQSRIAEGDRLMKAGDARGASFAYLDAINASPNNVEAQFKLGNAYAVLGYFTQAIQYWTNVTRLTADATVRRSAEQNIAKAQAKLPAQTSQVPSAAETPSAAPASPAAHVPAAVSATLPAHVPAAAPASSAAQPPAVAQAPAPPAQDLRPAGAAGAPSPRGQARGLYEQGVQQINARDYAGALKSLSESLQIEPYLTVAYVARGSALIGLRRFSEAAADYDYAHRLDPSLSSPLYGLAEAYRVMGRTSDARRFYELYAKSKAPDVRPDLQVKARDWAGKLR